MKVVKRYLVGSIVGALLACSTVSGASAQELTMVGNKVATYIDEHGSPARQMDIVRAALKGIDHSLVATTQAWYGSGLRSGKYSGYIDHYSLNAKQDNYFYSKPYLTINLHLASKTSEVIDIALLDQLGRARVGIETRFANTDQVRGERSVSWARSQIFYENVRQLADRRVDFIMADKDMIEQFNKLLAVKGEQLIKTSNVPFYIVDVSIAISKRVKGAESIIANFNAEIDALTKSGDIDRLLIGDKTRTSLLNPTVYKDILSKW